MAGCPAVQTLPSPSIWPVGSSLHPSPAAATTATEKAAAPEIVTDCSLSESSRSHPQQLLTVFRAERSLLVDIPTGWEPRTEQQPTGLIAHPTLWVGPYELHLLIFPQPLGRALKNQNAAPTTPPCFCRRQRSSSLLFESSQSHKKEKQSKSEPFLFDAAWAASSNVMVCVPSL